MSILFISDIHLDPARPQTMVTLQRLLNKHARTADALYILGDLFDAWIGDDDDAPLNKEVIQGLKMLSAGGTPVYFIHGNRDFLVGEQFARATGVTLLPEHAVIDLYGTPTLILHGDTLCTRDTAYMAFRKQVRNPIYQQAFLQKPLQERRAIAAHLRAESMAKNALKADNIMDVTPEIVSELMAQHKVTQMIHGHTHRPKRHSLDVNGQPAWRMVLGAWESSSSVLICDASGQRFINEPLDVGAARDVGVGRGT